MNDNTKLAIRVNPNNPDHHLWNNNGTWWCHWTLHLPDFTKVRFRTSLETGSISEARRLRDALLALFGWRAAPPAEAPAAPRAKQDRPCPSRDLISHPVAVARVLRLNGSVCRGRSTNRLAARRIVPVNFHE
jgi:hypothetical protein